MNLLSVEGVGKTFQDKAVFENISFGINQGQKIALIAKNGSGKTTLLKVVAGQLSPDQGEVNQRKGLNVSFLAQEPNLDPNRTVEECILQSGNPILKIISRYESALLPRGPRGISDCFEPWSSTKLGILKPSTSKFGLSLNWINLTQRYNSFLVDNANALPCV